MTETFRAGFDGSAKPNPGKMTIGGWIKDSKGNLISEFTEDIGDGTNNIAEYSGLISLLKEANKLGIKDIDIIGDSALVVNQVNGVWKVKDPKMKKLKEDVMNLLEGKNWKLEHVMRRFNSHADTLTR